MLCQRKSGVLLHPTSLPGDGGIGSLGGNARSFIDFLHAAGQSLWQILPLGPTAYGNSPYACYSAFAGNPLLINLEDLEAEGDILPADLRRDLPADRVDYGLVDAYKIELLHRAAERFLGGGVAHRREEFEQFCRTTPWLHDFALFMALKRQYNGRKWCDWPKGIAGRDPGALEDCSRDLASALNAQKYMQWQFSRQWRELRGYANQKGVGIIGDIPIFVAYDSADVWAQPHLFHLDGKGRPTVVAGVPPDYFSKTGQLWGNPLYDWQKLADDGYRWWIERMRSSLDLYDLVRLDHFRGFAAYWEVPAGKKTAVNGRWVTGPGPELFQSLTNALGPLPVIAEDLGVITPDVEALRDGFSFPGMKILQFAFGSGPENPYLPHNHIRDSVVYTGTHDNDTTRGWFAALSAGERDAVCRYLNISGEDISWDFIRTALVSVARTVIIPLQDILCLGNEAKMNTPGTLGGNWSWRFAEGDLTGELAEGLLRLTEMYGRYHKTD